MEKEILKETEVGDNISIGSMLRDDHIEFVVSTFEVSTSYLLSFQEWEEFVKCVNMANRGYKLETRE